MDSAERSQILEQLARGRQALGEAMNGIGEEQAAIRPGPDRWSVRDCVEHLAAVEEYLLGQLETAVPPETPVGSEARARRIMERAADRSRAVAAPQAVHPRGRFASLAEALTRFDSLRARTVGFVENCPVDPRTLVGVHPLMGPINCYETILAMALHPLRHAGQIGEIRAALV